MKYTYKKDPAARNKKAAASIKAIVDLTDLHGDASRHAELMHALHNNPPAQERIVENPNPQISINDMSRKRTDAMNDLISKAEPQKKTETKIPMDSKTELTQQIKQNAKDITVKSEALNKRINETKKTDLAAQKKELLAKKAVDNKKEMLPTKKELLAKKAVDNKKEMLPTKKELLAKKAVDNKKEMLPTKKELLAKKAVDNKKEMLPTKKELLAKKAADNKKEMLPSKKELLEKKFKENKTEAKLDKAKPDTKNDKFNQNNRDLTRDSRKK